MNTDALATRLEGKNSKEPFAFALEVARFRSIRGEQDPDLEGDGNSLLRVLASSDSGERLIKIDTSHLTSRVIEIHTPPSKSITTALILVLDHCQNLALKEEKWGAKVPVVGSDRNVARILSHPSMDIFTRFEIEDVDLHVDDHKSDESVTMILRDIFQRIPRELILIRNVLSPESTLGPVLIRLLYSYY
jgi:hypothetical protein